MVIASFGCLKFIYAPGAFQILILTACGPNFSKFISFAKSENSLYVVIFESLIIVPTNFQYKGLFRPGQFFYHCSPGRIGVFSNRNSLPLNVCALSQIFFFLVLHCLGL